MLWSATARLNAAPALKLSQPAAGQTSGSVKTPDDSSRISQQPIAAPLPGRCPPITTLGQSRRAVRLRVLGAVRMKGGGGGGVLRED